MLFRVPFLQLQSEHISFVTNFHRPMISTTSFRKSLAVLFYKQTFVSLRKGSNCAMCIFAHQKDVKKRQYGQFTLTSIKTCRFSFTKGKAMKFQIFRSHKPHHCVLGHTTLQWPHITLDFWTDSLSLVAKTKTVSCIASLIRRSYSGQIFCLCLFFV